MKEEKRKSKKQKERDWKVMKVGRREKERVKSRKEQKRKSEK